MKKSAVYLYNTGKPPVYYSGPYWNQEEIKAAVDCLTSGTWISSGEQVRKFEREFSKKFNCGHSVMVNSGSSANLVMIAAMKEYYNWSNFAEVIVSPTAFPTTISVLFQNNLTPVFADIEFETLNFDLVNVYNAINSNTVAIFLSPVLGNPPDMDALIRMCDDNDIVLILDGCDSLGTMWDGQFLSEFAEATSSSFYPAHHITTGEGGMVSTIHPQLYKIIRSMVWWGRDCQCVGAANLSPNGSCGQRFDKWLERYDGVMDHRYVFSHMGYNLKPLDLQGAIGLEQLKKWEEIDRRRKWAKAAVEAAFLDNIDGVLGVVTFDKADVCWFGTPLICEDVQLKHRLVKHLEANAIQTRNYFAGNILLHPGYAFLDDYRNYPQANKVLDKVFFVGASPAYTSETVQYFVDVLKKF